MAESDKRINGFRPEELPDYAQEYFDRFLIETWLMRRGFHPPSGDNLIQITEAFQRVLMGIPGSRVKIKDLEEYGESVLPQPSESPIYYAEHILDPSEKTVTFPDGKKTPFTPTEWRCLQTLATPPDITHTNDRLTRAIWGAHVESDKDQFQQIKPIINHLRTRLKEGGDYGDLTLRIGTRHKIGHILSHNGKIAFMPHFRWI